MDTLPTEMVESIFMAVISEDLHGKLRDGLSDNSWDALAVLPRISRRTRQVALRLYSIALGISQNLHGCLEQNPYLSITELRPLSHFKTNFVTIPSRSEINDELDRIKKASPFSVLQSGNLLGAYALNNLLHMLKWAFSAILDDEVEIRRFPWTITHSALSSLAAKMCFMDSLGLGRYVTEHLWPESVSIVLTLTLSDITRTFNCYILKLEQSLTVDEQLLLEVAEDLNILHDLALGRLTLVLRLESNPAAGNTSLPRPVISRYGPAILRSRSLEDSGILTTLRRLVNILDDGDWKFRASILLFTWSGEGEDGIYMLNFRLSGLSRTAQPRV